MGITIAFLQSAGIALFFIVISSNLARYGIMATPPNFKISPGMPSGLTDPLLPVVYKRFLIMLILTMKGFPGCVGSNPGLLLSQLNIDA
jgi:hypothetical protein